MPSSEDLYPVIPNPSRTVFQESFPYGVAAFTCTAVGAVVATTASNLIVIISGIALTSIGAYSFAAVLTCGFRSNDAASFKRALPRCISAIIPYCMIYTLSAITTVVIQNLIVNRYR